MVDEAEAERLRPIVETLLDETGFTPEDQTPINLMLNG